MAPPKFQGQILLEKAEKKAGSSTGWFSSSSTKWEEAGDLFQQAANAFKLETRFVEAGDAFSKEAECREKGGENNEAANAWWNAAKAYKTANRPDCKHMFLTFHSSGKSLIRKLFRCCGCPRTDCDSPDKVRPL